ncbi:MAG: ABC transporter ATP-binding protein, partial [Lachnospiraceae bacterium]|nr:ABC transporter ATP-binding protein [Lachnospiraceae bacterium]
HFEGIVITVSHDRYFLDRIVSRLFVFEGDGRIKPYEGGYTDYRRKCRAESDSAAEAGNKKVGSTKALNGAAAGSTKAQGGTAAGSTKAQGGAVAENGPLSEEAPSKKSWKSEHKIKFSYNEQREWDTIEEDIAILEARLPEIDNEMAANASNFVKLNELTKEKEETEQALEEKMERWEYLSEIYEKMNN